MIIYTLDVTGYKYIYYTYSTPTAYVISKQYRLFTPFLTASEMELLPLQSLDAYHYVCMGMYQKLLSSQAVTVS